MTDRSEKVQLLRQILRQIRFSMIPLASGRKKYILKHQVFDCCGKDLFWQPRKLPSDPKCIRIHDNVAVAADVTFINHDVIYLVINRMGKGPCQENIRGIEVMDNVFIGLGATVMPGVKIGPNAIVAARSVVTKDVPEGCVVAGSPAKVIGRFDDVVSRQLNAKRYDGKGRFDPVTVRQVWESFEEAHGKDEGKVGS